MKNFAKRLRRAREKRGLTRKQAVKGPLKGVSEGWLEGAEYGTRIPHEWMQEAALRKLENATTLAPAPEVP